MNSIGKIFHDVAVVTALCLLVVAFPVTVHAADRVLQLDSKRGSVGGSIGISGQNFMRNWLISIYMSPIDAKVGQDLVRNLAVFQKLRSPTSHGEGEFAAEFVIPSRLSDGDQDEDVHGGDYYIYATEASEGRIVAKAELTVAGVTKISRTKGPAGTEVSIEGAGYEEDRNITVFFDDDGVDILSGDTLTNTKGEFRCTIKIPEGTSGEHTIVIEDDTGLRGETKFTIEPEITVTPTRASDWDQVSVKGTGFSERVYVTIYFDGVEQTLAGTRSNDYGSFTTMVNISNQSLGRYYVEAEDEDNNEAKADLTITAGIIASPTTGNVGTEVTISGTGFKANGGVTITYAADEAAVIQVIADRHGKFTLPFTVPASKYGSHTITATDGTSTENTAFTMESNKPAVPVPVAPEPGIKAKPQVIFDWNDVDDPSGVAYNLEIGTSQGFTPESMVLRRTELKESGYTLSEEEQLKSAKQEKPYYWRVRAIDGASNESQWTEPRPFYVASTFELTGWVLYTLIGFAGLLILLIIGFLLSRRMAY